MIHSFKRKEFIQRMYQAFPKEYRDDVNTVCKRIILHSVAWNGSLFTSENSAWHLPSGETVDFPYRLFISDRLMPSLTPLTPREELIYHCIFTRCHNGYVREKHVRAILDNDAPAWAMPYVIKLCDEYIVEILQTVYERLRDRDCRPYRELCALNFDTFRRGYSRMTAYWGEYYRWEYYRDGRCRFREYVGKKLYAECFGYRKTGQKSVIV